MDSQPSGNLELLTRIASRKMQQGRKVPPLPSFTFKETGVTVQIRRLGPFTMDDIRKKLLKERKPPEVPEVVVEVGDARVKTREKNYLDPDYVTARSEYETWLRTTIAEKMVDLMVQYCIVCDPEPEIVSDMRELAQQIDPEVNESMSDKQIYIRYYLLSSPQAVEEVQNFIMGRSMPTEEVVQEQIDTFQGDVQGEGPVPTPGSPIRLPV